MVMVMLFFTNLAIETLINRPFELKFGSASNVHEISQIFYYLIVKSKS
jgi:hypothetical protein